MPVRPASEYAALRRTEGPSKVSTPSGVDAWVFSRYDDVRAVLVAIDRDPDEMMRVSGELNQCIVGLVLAKQAKHEDDLLSRLIARAEEQGQPLTVPELVSIGITLLIAGHETTANMIALSTLALLRNPGNSRRCVRIRRWRRLLSRSC